MTDHALDRLHPTNAIFDRGLRLRHAGPGLVSAMGGEFVGRSFDEVFAVRSPALPALPPAAADLCAAPLVLELRGRGLLLRGQLVEDGEGGYVLAGSPVVAPGDPAELAPADSEMPHPPREQVARELAAHLDLLLDPVPSIGVFLTDPARERWHYASRGLLSLLPPGEALPRPDRGFPDAERLHPDDRAGFVAQREAEAAGRPTDFVYRIAHPGAPVRWERLRTVPLRGPDGSLLVHGIVEDVTVAHTREDQLREHAGKLTNALALSLSGTWRFDVAHDRMTFDDNWFAMMGTTAGACGGHSMSSRDYALRFLHPEDRSLRRQHPWVEHGAAAGGDFSREFERRVVFADGSEGWLANRYSIEANAAGEVIALLGVGRNITSEKRAAAELERDRAALSALNADLARSNTALTQFTDVAAHDLQEPLRAVASCVQLLAMRNSGNLDDASLDLVRHAVEGAERMKRLLDDLLLYARAGRSARELVPVPLGAILADTLRMFDRELRSIGAIVSHDTMPTVLGNEVQFSQLLQNLVGNSIKFRRPDVPLRIRVGVTPDERPGRWRVTVSDNGIGVPPEYRERVLEMFRRLHTREAYPGTGIGLALCKKIVERAGGSLALVETEFGEGTTVAFTVRTAQ